jgi:hypothetical protein
MIAYRVIDNMAIFIALVKISIRSFCNTNIAGLGEFLSSENFHVYSIANYHTHTGTAIIYIHPHFVLTYLWIIYIVDLIKYDPFQIPDDIRSIVKHRP